MAGKGSKRRKENYQQFISNYDEIKWTPQLSNEQKDELMREVKKAFKFKNKRNKKC